MFHGSIPALVTPFKNDAVDRDAFAALVERQIEGGSTGLVPCGTTGEASTLSHEEHMAVVSLCVDVAAGRVPVIAGSGSNSTTEAIALTAHAKAAGADAALVVCPYYNRPDQSGMIAHFTAINDAVTLPVFIYNVPHRTGSDLSVDSVAKLARLPNIIGIKDATDQMPRVTQHAAKTVGDQFIQLSGNDPSALGHRVMGGAGCISVSANVTPKSCAALQMAIEAGDLAAARGIEARLSALHAAMFVSPSPGPAKFALSRLGLCEPDVRLPILPPDKAACEAIEAAMAHAGLKV